VEIGAIKLLNRVERRREREERDDLDREEDMIERN
jgi:hypothetical protein